MSEVKHYYYETKCRRCAQITNWYLSDTDRLLPTQFVDVMIDYIKLPRVCECEKCQKKTVQDVVSYSPNWGEDKKK